MPHPLKPWYSRIPAGPLIAPVPVVKLDSEGRIEWRGHVLNHVGDRSYRVRITPPRDEPSASQVRAIDDGLRVDLEHDQGFGYALQALMGEMLKVGVVGVNEVPLKKYEAVRHGLETFHVVIPEWAMLHTTDEHRCQLADALAFIGWGQE